MNSCLVVFQAILFAVVVMQYQFINEVDAEKSSFSVGNWFNSIEKKINVQFPYDEIEYEANASDCTNEKGVMSDVFQNIPNKAEEFVHIPRRMIQYSTTPNYFPESEDLQFNGLVNTQELADINAVELDASDITDEKNDTDYDNLPEPLPTIKKKKIKKHKKKNKVHHKKIDDLSIERALRKESSKKIKKEHRRKDKSEERKFVKMAFKESNNSESDEHIKRGKPVDIIVHIKMNE